MSPEPDTAAELHLDTQRMLASTDEGIGWMTFNNPARHNALSLEMWQGIGDILKAWSSDDAVRVVIMRGAGGKAFVSGADISEFEANRANSAQREHYDRTAGRADRWLTAFEKPMLALIEGYCVGGGLATALAADVRFATPDSRFGIPAAKLGLGYDYPGLAKLARLVGPSRARDILFSARLMNAAEAKAIGLVNFVVERDAIEAETIAYARAVAGNAPLTVKAVKAALNAWEAGADSADLERVKRLVDACFDSEDYKEGRRAFTEKRPPRFSGR